MQDRFVVEGIIFPKVQWVGGWNKGDPIRQHEEKWDPYYEAAKVAVKA